MIALSHWKELRRMIRLALPASVALFLFVAIATRPASQAAVKADGARKAAPDFTHDDASGKPIHLAALKGKVVVLNFWATWCGPCKVEMPWFIEFQKKYSAQDFTLLGASLDEEGWSQVKLYIERIGVNYPVVIADEMTAQKYGGVEALPQTFILDRTGKIAAVHTGLVSKDDYIADIEKILAEKPAVASSGGGVAEFAAAQR